jgi:alkylation response protein AidB-like acyl-CoA dehydrogenase
MTPTDPEQPLTDLALPQDLVSSVKANAHAIDSGEQTTQAHLSDIAAVGFAELGVGQSGGSLLEQATVIEALAEQSLSIAFSLWCHRMGLEYVAHTSAQDGDALLAKLRTTELIGSSAMAPGFQYAAGLGDLSLRVERDTTGQLRVSGHLGWASNLFDNAVIFAPAYGLHNAAPVVVAVPVSAEGVKIGPKLDLLALRGTASTSVAMSNVAIEDEQILSTELKVFLGRARPVLSLLQASFCLGLATESYRNTRTKLSGAKQVFETEVQLLADRLAQVKQQVVELASMMSVDGVPKPQQLLATRLEAGVLAKELTRLEVIAAGSQGFVTTSDANRRYREGTFIPLQAPSEAQLRWELGQSGDNA